MAAPLSRKGFLFLLRAKVRAKINRARSGEGPSLLECRTYRLSGHSRGDPCIYRPRDEETAARQEEPIARLERRLREEERLDDALLNRITARVNEEIADAIRLAEADPEPCWPPENGK